MSFQKKPADSVAGLPKTLRILGKRFHIRILKDGEEPEVDGLMEINKQRISIRPQEALEQVQDTSLHEAIHAIDESLSLGMTETQVHQLAVGVLGLLKDNPEYTKWLLKND